jgi:hypothetical protein
LRSLTNLLLSMADPFSEFPIRMTERVALEVSTCTNKPGYLVSPNAKLSDPLPSERAHRPRSKLSELASSGPMVISSCPQRRTTASCSPAFQRKLELRLSRLRPRPAS